MTLRQVIYRVVTGGGDPTQSGIYDSIGLYARVTLTDMIDPATDTILTKVKATYADTSVSPSDAATLYAKVNLADTAGAQADALKGLGLGLGDANATPVDALSALRLALSETPSPSPTDTLKTGFAGTGLNDAVATPTEARSTAVTTWASSQTTSGQAPTNPANAVGQANGTLAIVKGQGGVLSGTNSVMTLTIPVASIPATGAKTLRIYAKYISALVTSSVTYANTGGTPASGTVDFGTGDDATTTPKDIALTTIGTSLTVTFTAGGGLLGIAGEYDVDAIGVRVANPF